MRLFLDECIGDRSLSIALAAANHDVVRSIDELGGGVDDPAVFAFARTHNRIVVTYNCADFTQLSEDYPEHAGIILIYQDNRPTDMDTADIVKALSNVETSHPDGIAGNLIVLNAYRW